MSLRSDLLALLGRLRGLSAELLPAVSPTARYSNSDVLKMYAFRLLAHAEIESFIEDCASKLQATFSSKNESQTIRASLRNQLILHSEFAEKFPPRTLTVNYSSDDARKKLRASMRSLDSMISGNNGASEKDVLKLFIPLGFDLSFFDRDWLQAMNALAKARGDVAHNALANAVSVQPTPEGERALVAAAVAGLRPLVAEAQRLHDSA